MNENIDIRMSNYMTMLSNPLVYGKLDKETIGNMVWVLLNCEKETSK